MFLDQRNGFLRVAGFTEQNTCGIDFIGGRAVLKQVFQIFNSLFFASGFKKQRSNLFDNKRSIDRRNLTDLFPCRQGTVDVALCLEHLALDNQGALIVGIYFKGFFECFSRTLEILKVEILLRQFAVKLCDTRALIFTALTLNNVGLVNGLLPFFFRFVDMQKFLASNRFIALTGVRKL